MPRRATTPDPTTPLLRERLRALFRHLPPALAGDEEAVHQMRVMGRRLRVALPLLARKPEGKRVRRALRLLRRLTRVAGASRDLDVSLALLEERMAASGPAAAELKALRGRLRSARTRSRRRMSEELLDLEIARLRRDLRTILARRGDASFPVRSRLHAACEALAASIVTSLGDLGDRFEPEALHAVRRRVRRLRYAAEVSDALRGRKSDAPAAFKTLQERLGRLHDAWVLASWLRRQAEAAEARGRTALASEARAQEASFREASRSEHAALLASEPSEAVLHGLRAMGDARIVA